MSDHVDSLEKCGPLTRREFTLEAALALLAGCVITISDGCASATSPSSATPPADITGVISSNHNHAGVITGAQITAGNAFTFSIQGTAAHPHTLSITQADLTTLKNRQSVSREASADFSNTFGLHTHVVTFTPA